MPLSRILLVDDDPTILKLLASVFKAAGHDPITLQHSSKVLAFLKKEPVAAVVLDIIMPELDGWEVLRLLRADMETRRVPVVLLSSLSDVSHRVRGIRDGASDYMIKPCEPIELVARVERLIERGYAETSDLQGQLNTFSMEELCLSFEQYAKTGFLAVSSGLISGTCVLKQGQLVAARFGRLTGTFALEALLELRNGVFHFQNKNEIPPYMSDSPPQLLSSLLMNAAWLKDELHIRKNRIPEPEALLKIVGDVPDSPNKFFDLPFEETFEYIRAHPRISYKELLAQLLTSPIRMRLTLALLFDWNVVGVEENVEEEKPRTFQQFVNDMVTTSVKGDLHLYALVDKHSKASFIELLDSLPYQLSESDYAKLSHGTGLLQFTHDRGDLFLLFENLDPDGYPRQLKQFSFKGCIMLLGQPLARPKMYKLVSDFRMQLSQKSNLFVFTPSEKIRMDLKKVVPDLVIGIAP